MNLAQLQADTLELLRQTTHVDQGEPGELVLLERQASTGKHVPYKTISRAWCYSGQSYLDNLRLPPGVEFELRVSELELTDDDILKGVAWQHGARIFQVIDRPFFPAGPVRFYRFYLTLSEVVEVVG